MNRDLRSEKSGLSTVRLPSGASVSFLEEAPDLQELYKKALNSERQEDWSKGVIVELEKFASTQLPRGGCHALASSVMRGIDSRIPRLNTEREDPVEILRYNDLLFDLYALARRDGTAIPCHPSETLLERVVTFLEGRSVSRMAIVVAKRVDREASLPLHATLLLGSTADRKDYWVLERAFDGAPVRVARLSEVLKLIPEYQEICLDKTNAYLVFSEVSPAVVVESYDKAKRAYTAEERFRYLQQLKKMNGYEEYPKKINSELMRLFSSNRSSNSQGEIDLKFFVVLFSLQNIEANLVHQSSEVGISSFTQVGIINRAISELDGVLTSQLLPRVEATLKSLSLHDLSGESAAGERDLLVLNVRKATEALRAQVQGIWDVDQAREHYDSSLLEFLWSRLESDSSMI